MRQIEVVAAIIHDGEGRVFATQRGYGDYKDYREFPGGKIEPGETPEEALKREIWEVLEKQKQLKINRMDKVTQHTATRPANSRVEAERMSLAGAKTHSER